MKITSWLTQNITPFESDPLQKSFSNLLFSWKSILSGQKRCKQLERAVGINENLEFFKLESFHLSWKLPIEAGKFSMQYSRSNQKLSNFGSNFPTSFFPISIRIFPLLVFPTFLSNYMRPGQSHSILSKVATRWRYFTYNLDFLRSHFLPIMFSLSKKSCFWKKNYIYAENIKTNLWMLIRIDEKGFVTFSDGHQFGLNSIQTILKGDSSQIKNFFS